MLVTQKFGGSSLRDTARLTKVAARVAKTYDDGVDVVVVVSAQGDLTDKLLNLAAEIHPFSPKRETDALLVTGEQQSAALLAMALYGLGYPAVSLTGWQAPIFASSRYGDALIKRIETKRIFSELKKRKIVIVAGFQGLAENGDAVTLGRGASDTVAVALAAALEAQSCEIFTDIDGVYTADPRIVPSARRLACISYEQMFNLAQCGAKVLCARACLLAKRFGVKVAIKSTFGGNGFTLMSDCVKINKINNININMEEPPLGGVTLDGGLALILILGENINGRLIFETLKQINIDSASVAPNGAILAIKREELRTALNILGQNREKINYERLEHITEAAKITVVGTGFNMNVIEAAYKALEGFLKTSVIVSEVSKTTLVLEEKQASKTLNILHDLLFGVIE